MRRFIRAVTVALSVAAAGVGGTHGQALSPVEQRIVAHVDARADAAVALLEQTVNMNSGTFNHAGVRAVGEVMAERFRRWASTSVGPG